MLLFFIFLITPLVSDAEVRTLSYYLPPALAEAVKVVGPTVTFPRFPGEQKIQAYKTPLEDTASPVDPSILRELYGQWDLNAPHIDLCQLYGMRT